MANEVAVRVDNKGRLMIPKELRQELQVGPGDTLFIRCKGKVLHCAKAENPFDLLAEHAIREDDAGLTISLRDFAREQGIDLDAE